jgi:hypothetical protein
MDLSRAPQAHRISANAPKRKKQSCLREDHHAKKASRKFDLSIEALTVRHQLYFATTRGRLLPRTVPLPTTTLVSAMVKRSYQH